MHQAIVDEILQERVVSSRGRRNPRALKRSVGKYPIRMRSPAAPARADFGSFILVIK